MLLCDKEINLNDFKKLKKSVLVIIIHFRQVILMELMEMALIIFSTLHILIMQNKNIFKIFIKVNTMMGRILGKPCKQKKI